MNLRIALIALLAGLIAIFIIQNVAAVEVSFLFWSISMSRALLIFFIWMIGLIMGWFLRSYLSYQKSKDKPANNA